MTISSSRRLSGLPVSDWNVIGPFPNPDGKALVVAYPPETEIALSKKYKGRDGKEVGWQRVTRTDGIIMLNDLFEPKEYCVVYGACVVNAPRGAKRTLLLGSDDGVRVWLNGKLVWDKPVQRPLTPDSDQVEVELQEIDGFLRFLRESLIKIRHLGFDCFDILNSIPEIVLQDG